MITNDLRDPSFRNRMLTKGIHVFEVPNKTNEIAPHTLFGVAVLWGSVSEHSFGSVSSSNIPIGLRHEASVIVAAVPGGWKILKSRFGVSVRSIIVPTWNQVLEQFDPKSAIQ